MDGRYLVQRRLFGEVRDVREFIQPDSAVVVALARTLPDTGDNRQLLYDAWRAVRARIRYPARQPYDLFTASTVVASGGGCKAFEDYAFERTDTALDYWMFPAESLAVGIDDCEGSTFAVVSVLRNFFAPDQVWATLGTMGNQGHAWATLVDDAGGPWTLEATRSPETARLEPEAKPYTPYLRFNDQVVLELRPGLLGPRVLAPLAL